MSGPVKFANPMSDLVVADGDTTMAEISGTYSGFMGRKRTRTEAVVDIGDGTLNSSVLIANKNKDGSAGTTFSLPYVEIFSFYTDKDGKGSKAEDFICFEHRPEPKGRTTECVRLLLLCIVVPLLIRAFHLVDLNRRFTWGNPKLHSLRRN